MYAYTTVLFGAFWKLAEPRSWVGALFGEAALEVLFSVSIYLYIYPGIYLCLYLSIYLSTDLSIYLSNYLSIYRWRCNLLRSIYLSVYLLIELALYKANLCRCIWACVCTWMACVCFKPLFEEFLGIVALSITNMMFGNYAAVLFICFSRHPYQRLYVGSMSGRPTTNTLTLAHSNLHGPMFPG